MLKQAIQYVELCSTKKETGSIPFKKLQIVDRQQPIAYKCYMGQQVAASFVE